MEKIIVFTCVLIVLHILCPLIIESLFFKNLTLNDLFSSRDKKLENSKYYHRAKRSFNNLFETLPIFIMLIMISMIKDVDNYNLALSWLIFRLMYIPIYVLGLNYIRTIIWASSFFILALMAIKFI